MKWPILLKSKPQFVRAMKWTGDNYSDLRAWGAPVTFLDPRNEDHRTSRQRDLWLWVATCGVQVRLAEGEWIVKNSNNEYDHVSDRVLLANFELAEHE